jgi:hypothetical protein
MLVVNTYIYPVVLSSRSFQRFPEHRRSSENSTEDPTATRILAYRSHNEGHRPSTINQGFSPLQWERSQLSANTIKCSELLKDWLHRGVSYTLPADYIDDQYNDS